MLLGAADSAVVSVGFVKGGSAYNAIPDGMHIGGTSRSFRPAVPDLIERRIGEIARGATALPGAHRRDSVSQAPATLTRLTALGTLSRSAGEGLQRVLLKAPLPHRGRGGTKPAGLGG